MCPKGPKNQVNIKQSVKKSILLTKTQKLKLSLHTKSNLLKLIETKWWGWREDIYSDKINPQDYTDLHILTIPKSILFPWTGLLWLSAATNRPQIISCLSSTLSTFQGLGQSVYQLSNTYFQLPFWQQKIPRKTLIVKKKKLFEL